jgi:uncharacterized protein involved in type VI secretion and phage assembly
MTTTQKKSGKDKGKLTQHLKSTRAGSQVRKKGKGKDLIVESVDSKGEPAKEIGYGSTSTRATQSVDASPVRFTPESAGKWYGVYPALVTDIKDPDEQGRVKIELPWMTGQSYNLENKGGGHWARLATLMAGDNRGSWFIPEVDDEVLVAFEGGDPSHPYVLGALWNGKDRPPVSMDSRGKNNYKSLKSRNGVQITLDDTDGRESLNLETPAGQKITLTDRNNSVRIEDNNGNSIEFDSKGIFMLASAKVIISSGTVEISAGDFLINAGMAKFAGVVKCDTLITNSVISSSYTPGAGNVT